MPAKESTKYLSYLGHLDLRFELDKGIKPGDKRYFAGLSVMASKLAYENNAFCKAVVEDQWKMEFLGTYDFWNEYQERNSTQGLIFHDKSANPDMVIVAFRGTELFNSDDWCTDFDLSWTKFKTMGYVHSGFMKALGLQKDQSWPENVDEKHQLNLAYYSIREKLRKIFQQNSQTRFILTGHSLGGALAVLFPAILALHDETSILERLEAIYTFGQPRVGDEIFGNFVNAQLKQYGVKYYRFVYNYDIVCRLPYDSTTLMFKHFGTCIYYNSLYQGKIVPREPHKNYFSFRAIITRTADCLWEFLRGFLLPRLYGPEYREGLLLLGLRLIGVLLMPGLPAHSIHEYINAIRLGTADLFC
ncbi:OLC1v1010158C2 [Oldenlandia corymbosa var. corymbosa]|nr:OLC1v1010158C2 [Oldenlandia corymbosa var. corymbosa]